MQGCFTHFFALGLSLILLLLLLKMASSFGGWWRLDGMGGQAGRQPGGWLFRWVRSAFPPKPPSPAQSSPIQSSPACTHCVSPSVCLSLCWVGRAIISYEWLLLGLPVHVVSLLLYLIHKNTILSVFRLYLP